MPRRPRRIDLEPGEYRQVLLSKRAVQYLIKFARAKRRNSAWVLAYGETQERRMRALETYLITDELVHTLQRDAADILEVVQEETIGSINQVKKRGGGKR